MKAFNNSIRLPMICSSANLIAIYVDVSKIGIGWDKWTNVRFCMTRLLAGWQGTQLRTIDLLSFRMLGYTNHFAIKSMESAIPEFEKKILGQENLVPHALWNKRSRLFLKHIAI
ncbi:hypothetical protein NPIL_69761 [Nephila pilipes]|uniref:Uncharacterized protein n=1 Tax=Nephila pilipes TaxID=299642 RepID=A0A8X6PPW1_NEPPI|nr:hypothetical protein NPIL_69761 [Nephila pilipes]